MPLFGPPDIQKLKAKRDVNGLIKALGYKVPHVRKLAAEALGEIKDSRAVESLIAALADKESWLARHAAARALGEIKDDRAVEPLIQSLKEENEEMRAEAAKALGSLKNPRAVPPLVAALKDGNRDVRNSSVRALDMLGWQPDQDEAAAIFWVGKREWKKCVAIGALAVEPLITALKDYDSDVCNSAADALGEIGDVRAVEPLIAALKNGRDKAAIALGKLGDARVVEPLLAALKANRYKHAMYDAVSDALARIGSPAFEPLIAALKDDDAVVRNAAANALGNIGDTRVVEPLIAALKGGCEGAIRALGGIGDPRAVTPLIAVLGSNRIVGEKQVAKEALVRIGAAAIEPLVSALNDPQKRVREAAAEAIYALRTFVDERNVEPLLAALKDSSTIVRRCVTLALGETLDARAVEPLIAALETEDLQQDATQALAKIGEPAFGLLAAAFQADDPKLRPAALQALVELGLKQEDNDLRRHVFELLLVAFKNGESSAVQGLGVIGTLLEDPALIGQATNALIDALMHGKKSAHAEVAVALDQLGWRPDQDEIGARYWVARQGWDECVEIGVPAVEPLLAALKGKDPYVSIGAARALVAIHPKIEESALRKRFQKAFLAALQNDDQDVRKQALEALDKIGWHPAGDEISARYWITNGRYAECIRIGAPAVGPLIAALQAPLWSDRKAAAEALVSIYKRGKLDKAEKSRIVQLRNRIIEKHDDRYQDFDPPSGCDAGFAIHERVDEGIGVDFPL